MRIGSETSVLRLRIEIAPVTTAPFGTLAALLRLTAEYGQSAALQPEIDGRGNYGLCAPASS